MISANVVNKGNLAEKLAKYGKIKGRVKMGFFAGATYPGGTSVAYVAYLNEYGGHNPPRPFMKRTAEKQGKKWANGILENVKGNFSQSTWERALQMCGTVGQGDIVKTIRNWPSTDPYPNDNKTIEAKRRRAQSGKNLVPINPNAVLIDTGQMISSVKYEVEK